MTDGTHPIVTTFDDLLLLREFKKRYQNNIAGKFLGYCSRHFAQSSSQRFQDLFVCFFLNEKRNGFFVEFGATNGYDLSNTLLLERNLQWNGILVEPAKCWHSALKNNRHVSIDTRCVWSESGVKLDFKETANAELSTLANLTDRDFHKRDKGISYLVETISLNDLLKAYNSPKEIDYVSIDTEGSELAILSAFRFDDYDIKIISVEHNYCEPDRQTVYELLTAQGFVRVFKNMSKFDDWYIKRSIVGV